MGRNKIDHNGHSGTIHPIQKISKKTAVALGRDDRNRQQETSSQSHWQKHRIQSAKCGISTRNEAR